MGVFIRYAAVALLSMGAAIFAISPLANTLVEQRSIRDVELRSTLVFNSVRDELMNFIVSDEKGRIEPLFERLALDERLLAVGFCDHLNQLLYRSRLMPSELSGLKVARSDRSAFSTIDLRGHPTSVGSFPIAKQGHLVLLHDLTFAAQRGARHELR